jgi:hypothetical protein
MDYNPSPYGNPGGMPVPTAPALKHSGFGITSFVLSIVSGLGVLGAVVLAGYDVSTMGQDGYNQSGQAVIVGIFIILAMLGEGLAFIFGMISLFIKGRKKIFGILGLIFTVLPVLLFFVLMVIGLVAKANNS